MTTLLQDKKVKAIEDLTGAIEVLAKAGVALLLNPNCCYRSTEILQDAGDLSKVLAAVISGDREAVFRAMEDLDWLTKQQLPESCKDYYDMLC